MIISIKYRIDFSIAILFLIFIALDLNSQYCLEYPVIDGDPCGLCAPEGWDVVSDTPDILDPMNSFCNPEPSPTGGNVMHLWANGFDHFEAVSSSFEIPGFVYGQEYYFGIYFAGCSAESYSVVITVNGEEYEINPEDSWEYFELCLMPETEQVSIEIGVLPYFTNIISSTTLDTGECDIHYCCSLDAELDKDEIDLCPGEEQEIVLNVIDEVGNVEIEWSCDPPDGLDYMDDPFSANPNLSIPFEDHDKEVFLYTVRIEDEDCYIFRELELTINTSKVPEFEVYLCELYEEYQLPLSSNEGYSGSWEGNFYWDELAGSVREYTFTLDPGQDNCIEAWTYEFAINFAEEVSFEVETVFCVTDEDTYMLPEESEERIEGEWDEDRFTPDELGTGTHTFTFEIDRENYCAEDFVLEIQVVDDIVLEFDIPTTYCSSMDSIFLADTTLQGIAGIWTSNMIDLNTAVDSQSLVFSTIDSSSCISEYELIYSVLNGTQNSFDIPDTVCRSLSFMEFDSNSLEGYRGFWTPQAVSFDTISSDQFEILWTPLDTNQCLSPSTVNINIVELEQVEFNLPANICTGTGVFELPSTSMNGLTGTWNISEFDPDTLSTLSIDLIFTPDTECTEIYYWSISINNDILDQTDFDIESVLCRNTEAFDLPISTINGVTGTWSQLSIDPMDILDSLVISFYPDNDINTCYDTFDFKFIISDLIEPSFDLPSLICANSEQITFPNNSSEGISGAWDITELNPGDLIGIDSLLNVFHPFDSECYSDVHVSIPVYEFENLDYAIIQPSSCREANGSIQVLFNDNIELSIDSGANWVDAVSIDNLAEGQYQLIVRSIENLCQDTVNFSLSSPEPVNILELQIDSIIDCSMQGARLNCIAEGPNLEYSLNDSGIWTEESLFSDLSPGQYWIYVRNARAMDCVDSLEFIVEAFEQTELLDVLKSDVTACKQMDGSIEVMATGQNLEYSINGGQDWQILPLFENLGIGTYDIKVRSIDAHDCFDEMQVTINSPEAPAIQMVDIIDQSSCILNNGSLEVFAEGNNLEHSIDGGINWYDTRLFEGLPGGLYLVMVREKEDTDCYASIEIELRSPVQLQVQNVELQQPGDCFDSDAYLEINVNSTDVEFSIDNGINWQSENQFTNLDEGAYEVLIQNPLFPDCGASYAFEISLPPCPCDVLSVELFTEAVDCLDPISGSVSIESIEGNIIGGDIQIIWDDGTEGYLIQNLSEGWVSYSIFYNKNCDQNDSVYIESFDPIGFDLLSFDQDCEELGTIEVVNFMGGAGQPSYSIDGINFQENSVFTDLTAQEYQVLIEDLFNCSGEDSVVINDNSNLQLDLPQVEPMQEGESRMLNPLINEATIDSFEWYPINGILNPGNLVAHVSPQETSTYTLTIYFGDCIEIRSVTVEVIKDPALYIANMFSPNDDGSNDLFLIQSDADLDLIIDSFQIYDRWGNIVFEANEFRANSNEWAWDGRHNDKKVDPGVFIYQIIYTLDNVEKILTGSITVVK